MNDYDTNSDMSSGNRPEWSLRRKAKLLGLNVYEEKFAKVLDQEDVLSNFRDLFIYPKMKDLPCVDQSLVNPERDCIYLCGHSLGLKPKSVDQQLQTQLQAWGKWGVFSHFVGDLPGAFCDKPGREMMGKLIGAKPKEIALMNGLTVNLNLLLISFYKPVPGRHKILIEDKAFPSDKYAIVSHITFHGYQPETSLLTLRPRSGEHTLRPKDILERIKEEGDEIALILLGGVQYYTGQKFDMEAITEAGHEKKCIVGFDLAHAVGNVKLDVHKWDIDFACWCSYKYLNSGAGGLAGIFVHEKHNRVMNPQLLGWWSNKEETRFEMREDIDVSQGSESFRVSNPSPFLASMNLASLEIFMQTSMDDLTSKQFLLTGYFEMLLKHYCWPATRADDEYEDIVHLSGSNRRDFEIITPSDPNQRGSQLSLLFCKNAGTIEKELMRRGVICDARPPKVIRFAPIPLYNSFQEVYRAVLTLKQVLDQLL